MKAAARRTEPEGGTTFTALEGPGVGGQERRPPDPSAVSVLRRCSLNAPPAPHLVLAWLSHCDALGLQLRVLGASCPSSLGPRQRPCMSSLGSGTEVGAPTGQRTPWEGGAWRWARGRLSLHRAPPGEPGRGRSLVCGKTSQSPVLGGRAWPFSVRHPEAGCALSRPVSFNVVDAGSTGLDVDGLKTSRS